MNEKIVEMKEKVALLNQASRAYYQEAKEIMSNYEYDKLYDELLQLEQETGTTWSNSPTIHVGYEILSELPKEEHETPMLSLDKTKEVAQLASWLNGQTGVLSWKLDGLTVVLTYENGTLVKGVTRGNGQVGEVITNNVKVFKNVPLHIPFQGKLVLRGEAVINYSDFRTMNQQISEVDAKYKNPRNLCSGSVRQLNNQITAQRNVRFYAFSLVSCEDEQVQQSFENSRKGQMEWLRQQGFDVVENVMVTSETIEEKVHWFANKIEKNDIPSDGLVLILDDIAYGQSLGSTAKFPRDAIAFKWQDEIKEAKLLEIEWSASRTGLINPVAIFEPVELEGTTVSRASLHNISIMEGLELGIGDTICVYKANMIIPQIADNLTRSGSLAIPEKCPVCGQKTRVKQENDVKSLYCINPECLAKKIKLFTHFVSRNAMNIEGLSEATIEKFIGRGFIKELSDIFHLKQWKDEMTQMEGFGEKSFSNLITSIENARKVTLPCFIYSLGIPNVGLSNAKLICKQLGNDFQAIRQASMEDLVAIEGIGEVIAQFWIDYFGKDENKKIVDDLLKEIEFEKEEDVKEQIFEGINFVITGTVEHFSNRNEVKELIESKGGKVTGSVTSKTNYLINNDNTSGSSKNKKAKELGVPIITEKEFLKML